MNASELKKFRKQEWEQIKKTPAKEIRLMYLQLIDEVRQKTWGKRDSAPTNTALYRIGWRDGYNVGISERGK